MDINVKKIDSQAYNSQFNFKSVIPTLLLTSFMLFMPIQRVLAESIQVDVNDNDCASSSGQADAYVVTYCKISHAIVDAQAEDVINVASGEYLNDFVSIDKKLTLLGANADVDPDGSLDRGDETVVLRDDLHRYSIESSASGSIVKGFKFGQTAQCEDTFWGGFFDCGRRLDIKADTTDIVIENNIFQKSLTQGVGIPASAERIEITNNTFAEIAEEAIKNLGAVDTIINGNTINNLGGDFYAISNSGLATISNNTITNVIKGISNSYVGSSAFDRTEISSNNISNVAKTAVYAEGAYTYIAANIIDSSNDQTDWTLAAVQLSVDATNAIVFNNQISDSLYGISVLASDVLISTNQIYSMGVSMPETNGGTYKNSAVIIGNSDGSIDPTSVVLQNNKIYDNYFGISHAGEESVVASNNYWDSVYGPTHSSNSLGMGVEIDDNISFSAWFTSDSLTDKMNIEISDSYDYLVFDIIEGDNTAIDDVDSNLNLLATGPGDTTYTWLSSDTNVIGNNGVVIFPSIDTAVVVTATINKVGSVGVTKDFNITVSTEDVIVSAANVANGKSNLVFATIKNTNTNEESIVENLVLPVSGASSTSISWSSSDNSVVDANGNVYRIEMDAEVVLTATITRGSISDVKSFSLTVLELSDIDELSVSLAKAGLTNQIILADNKSISKVLVDLDLPTSLAEYDGVSLSWSSNSASLVVNAQNGIVSRSELNNVTVLLTATLTKASASDTKVFTIVIKKIDVAAAIDGLINIELDTEEVFLNSSNIGSISRIEIPTNIESDQDIVVNFLDLLVGNDLTLSNELTLVRKTNEGDYSVYLPANISIAGPSGWSGLFDLPQIESVSVVTADLERQVIEDVISVGLSDEDFSFDKAVQIIFPDQGSNSVGFLKNGQTTYLMECTASELADPDVNLVADTACFSPLGENLIVYTKHFTSFFTYTISPSSGGGGGGSSYITLPVINNITAVNTPLKLEVGQTGELIRNYDSLTVEAGFMNKAYTKAVIVDVIEHQDDADNLLLDNKYFSLTIKDVIGRDLVDFAQPILISLFFEYEDDKEIALYTYDSIEKVWQLSESFEVDYNTKAITFETLESTIFSLFELDKKLDVEESNNEDKILNNKIYIEGDLMRGDDMRIYVIKDWKKVYISSFEELAANYAGQRIIKVSQEIIDLYEIYTIEDNSTNDYWQEDNLVRDSQMRIYIINNGQAIHIQSLEELQRDFYELPIFDLDESYF
jgi:Atrophied bacterial Ig domain/Right handed beta helix region